MPLSLTPQSLKRKLQSSSDSNTATEIEVEDSSLRSPPTELFLPRSPSETSSTNFLRSSSSPLRGSQSSSPTKSFRAATIIHSNASQNYPSSPKVSSLSPFQSTQLYKLFSKRAAPFPLELLKPSVLAEFFLKGRALERYFQRRFDEIRQGQSSSDQMDTGLRPLERPFVRSSPPSVPFAVYLERLFRYCHPEPLHLLAIVTYSERLIKSHGMYVPPQGWHRFVVAAWIVAGKALLGDQYWTNLYWARVAGISIAEICALESEFVLLLDWRLQIPIEELTAAWYMIQL